MFSRSWTTDSVAGAVAGRGGDRDQDEYDSEVFCRSTGSRVRRDEGDGHWYRSAARHREQRGYFHRRYVARRY